MKIWVDGDACPKPVKEILFRAAERVKMPLKWVANQPLQAPPSRYIETLRVGAGFDVADNTILQSLAAGDLVITGDIPLAAAAIEKGALALSPRGMLYTAENIQESLAMRNFLDELRSSGVKTGGPGTFSQVDRHAFAQRLDKVLAASQRGTR